MNKSNYLKFAGLVGASTILLSAVFVSADVSSNILPTSDGNYTQWTTSTGTSHFALIDESACNGNTDYNFTSTVGNRDSYGVDISSVPNGSQITKIEIKPCASRNAAGGANPTMNLFYRYNNVNSADSGSYSLSATTPVDLATTSYSGLSVIKTATSTLESGAVLTSGTKGVRLSRIQTVITYTTLGAPTSLTDTVSTTTAGKITLGWGDNSTFESGYLVERSTDNVNWIQIATTTANAVSYNDTGLVGGTLYYHRVRAYNVGGFSSYSNIASGTPLSAPTAPSSLVATATTTSTNITLEWVDNSSNETGFLVERSLNGVSGWSNIATTTANVVTTTNTGLVASTTYYYRVRAYNTLGNSAYTSVASATTAAKPVAPSSLASSLSGLDISLAWTDNSTNELGFVIDRKVGVGGFFLPYATTTTDIANYLDTGLLSSTTYIYRVRAYNIIGYSLYSNLSTTTTP